MTKKKLKALIFIANEFEDFEFFFPFFRLLEQGIEVDVAGPEKGQVVGEHGYHFDVQMTFDEVKPEEYDLLILPGGSPHGAPLTVSKNKKAQEITKSFGLKDKPLAAICHGPYTLISSGVVKGRKVTSFWGDGVPEELKKAGAHYTDQEVVVDKNLVTSRYPGDLPAFMRETIKLLEKHAKK